jgi:Flp pilus assembly protein TadD
LKLFPDLLYRSAPRHRGLRRPALAALSLCGLLLIAWQARAALPRWMQDAIGASAIEAALYRVMQLPGGEALYPRPPKEVQGELNGLIAKAPDDAALYSLRATEEEQALDFSAAEADWKMYASRAKDRTGGELELADYYHRRLQAIDEVRTLMKIGSAPARPEEQYTLPNQQRSWQAFERILPLVADQRLDDELIVEAYAAWIVHYPQQPSVYAREFLWLLDRKKDAKKFDRASELIVQYRRTFPQDAVFPLKATAMVEYRRGSVDSALKTYDAGFDPLWPAELVQSYYGLLAETHTQRRFMADARARLAQNPDDLNAMARLFYYAQQQGNLISAQQVVEAYRLSKDDRKAAWSAQELYTLAQLMEAIHAYPEAARYDFALYHAQSALTSGASPQAEGLGGIIRILLTAPEQPVELGASNLSMYRDIATLDRGPGYWNGILSLWFNSTSPEQSYHLEEQRAQPYFHRTKAAELLALLDKSYPNASGRAGLHKELIHALADYGESALVLKSGVDFLSSFTSTGDEDERVAVAMNMADAYARQRDTKGEFALYDRLLAELSASASGMPLTAAAASGHVIADTSAAVPETGEENSAAGSNDTTARKNSEKSRAFEVSVSQPAALSITGAQQYTQVLERYLGRLTSTGQLPQALAVLRRELDRNPNDPLFYERLASFLQQNNLSAQQEEVYNQAAQKFQDKGWYDKLARLYLREKKREAFADLTKKVTGIFSGTELEHYFSQVTQGGPQLFLQLNLFAHQRFPHDLLFVQNLLQAYNSKPTRDPLAWEKLLREHWSDSEQLRLQFFDYLSRTHKLDAELARLHELTPGTAEQKGNPAAARELAEAEMWRSHFEESAPLLGALAEAYPADEEIGTQASSVFRSLAYNDAAQTARAVTIEEHLLAAKPADADRLARIGDIYADSGADGADSSSEHENISAATRYWRRMPDVHPGRSDGYLQAATVFWDYFQFDDALAEIHQARKKFDDPALFGYEAGAIYEGKRDLSGAIVEYTAAASTNAGSVNGSAAGRLVQLARRKGTAKLVDEETTRSLDASGTIPILELRVRVLKAQKRDGEIGPQLEAVLGKATTFDQAQAIAQEAQANSLTRAYEAALQREVVLAVDPVQKIELSYELVRSFEGRKDLDDASRIVDNVYRENAKLLGVVRATTDFYWKNKQSAKAIATLIEAAKAAGSAEPALSRQFVVEAADKANNSDDYAQARSLMAPLIDTAAHSSSGSDADFDAFNPQYLAVVAESYARAGDDAGLKRFYLAELTSIRTVSPAMNADERKQKTALLRRGLIPALTRMKDFAGAVDQYIAILSAYPEDASTAQEASLYALRNGRRQQLAEFADSTVKASPRDSRFAILLAQIETAFEDYPAAIEAYAHAIKIRSDRADVYTAKANLEERLQRLDDACKEYERLYVLSYRNPDWMVKVAEVRARQGRKEDAVKALERAWIEGHPPNAVNYFRVAKQLESWAMLEESLRFAELGVKAEGDHLLAGSDAGNQNEDDPDGVILYARLMTRLRKAEIVLNALNEARKAVALSPNSPGLVVEQVEKQGVAAVTDSEWREHRIEQRRQAVRQRFHGAVVEMGKTVGLYFTPEEKKTFAGVVDARWTSDTKADRGERSVWIEAASAAGIKDEEASLRKQTLLDRTIQGGAVADAQFGAYVQLERSRMEFAELAQTMEAYAPLLKPAGRRTARVTEAQAYRDAGDEAAELRVLRRIGLEQGNDANLRERYLQLLLKHDAPGFESLGATSKDDAIALAAPNYAASHSDSTVTQAALDSHAATLGDLWKNAYTALLGLYFHELTPRTEDSFHAALGDQKTIGERLGDRSGNHSNAHQFLSGGAWFYYAMRYGAYRTLSPEKEWFQQDPEDFLASGLEGNASATGSYLNLARAYAGAGKMAPALTEYGHALELAPDSPAIHDSIAVIEWQTNDKDAAIAQWREAFAALNRIQDKGPAPESFWTSFALMAQHIQARSQGTRKLTGELHGEMDGVLRNYMARNGDYRSDELLRAAFAASASHSEGLDWILSLSASAPDQAAMLTDIDSEAWLPKDAREPILLRELALARIAAQRADNSNDYMTGRVVQLQKSLVLYYVEEKQDAKAQAMIEALTDEERKDGSILQAQIELAARRHVLDAWLVRYRADAETLSIPGGSQLLRNAAGVLATQGDQAGALALWECVFDLGQAHHDLLASDYLGLAAARLRVGNVSGAVELLRRLTQLPGDVYANYDLAATLLEEKAHDAEAVEFLTVLAKGVPWDVSYTVRLARAQLHAGNAARIKPPAVAVLESVARNSGATYDIRVQAAMALREAGVGEAPNINLGSEELHLLAAGNLTAERVQQPYFVAARMVASDTTQDLTKRALLLRQTIAVSPLGMPTLGGFAGSTLRLKIFRAESNLKHDATALNAIEPLLNGSYSDTTQSVSNIGSEGQPEVGEAGTPIADENDSTPAASGGEDSLAELERLAPLPVRTTQTGAKTDAEKLALAVQIASVYERTERLAEALPYLKLAARLQKDNAAHMELRSRIEQIQTALALEAQNALRRPDIRRALDQSNLIRPRLSNAADLAHEEAAP